MWKRITPYSMFVAITASSQHLHALDEDGRVWRYYGGNMAGWRPISCDRWVKFPAEEEPLYDSIARKICDDEEAE